jgi:hypothetical protein
VHARPRPTDTTGRGSAWALRRGSAWAQLAGPTQAGDETAWRPPCGELCESAAYANGSRKRKGKAVSLPRRGETALRQAPSRTPTAAPARRYPRKPRAVWLCRAERGGAVAQSPGLLARRRLHDMASPRDGGCTVHRGHCALGRPFAGTFSRHVLGQVSCHASAPRSPALRPPPTPWHSTPRPPPYALHPTPRHSTRAHTLHPSSRHPRPSLSSLRPTHARPESKPRAARRPAPGRARRSQAVAADPPRRVASPAACGGAAGGRVSGACRTWAGWPW